jgi:hypothetical protein
MTQRDARQVAETVVQILQEEDLVATAPGKGGLVSLQALAEEEGVAPSTIRRRYIYRKGLPVRNAEGYPKERHGRTAFLSRAEIEAGEELPTETVRRRAGLQERSRS